MNDPFRLTALAAIRHIQAGRLTPLELMESCLERIALREPSTRALVDFDPEQARRAARSARPGRLHGIPIGVKDVLDTADLASQYGSGIWRGHRPRADAACVALARAQGAALLGKTVTTEFAVRVPGPTTNPHNAAHTPGGSSSGSAAGVADFYFPLSIGTQTAGSTIRPAAFCGVVGYKPTYGMIPRMGMKLMSESLDTVGVMARSVADCALFAGVMSARNLGDPDSRAERAPRIGICRSPAWDDALPETHALMERIGRRAGRRAARLVEYELPSAYASIMTSHMVVQFHESALSMAWELQTHRDAISETLRTLLDEGSSVSPDVLAEAYGSQAMLRRAFADDLGDLDILLTPAAPGQAPKGLRWSGGGAFNRLWTTLHVPCVTVPAGVGPDGLPLGIQIVGRRGHDAAVLAWARWLQAELDTCNDDTCA